jgi:hypothetical protein
VDSTVEVDSFVPDSTLVVIDIEVVIRPRSTFLVGFSALMKNDVNKVDIAINAAKDNVTIAESSEIPLLIKLICLFN